MLRSYRINVNGKSYEVEVEEIGAPVAAPTSTPIPVAPIAPQPVAPAPVVAPEPVVSVAPASSGEIIEAPMPGTVVELKVAVGDTVREGDVVAIVEAMKMETDLVATKSGVVTKVVAKGTNVDTGDAIITL